MVCSWEDHIVGRACPSQVYWCADRGHSCERPNDATGAVQVCDHCWPSLCTACLAVAMPVPAIMHICIRCNRVLCVLCRSTVAYIQQQDCHIGTSTVYEALMFSASLRLPHSVTQRQRHAIVDEVCGCHLILYLCSCCNGCMWALWFL
jgi:hypothetical protein